MKEKDLPIDLTKHKVYSKNAEKCVRKLLHRYYDEKTAADLWEKIQLQYCEYLRDEPAMAGAKITASIYDPILIFAWYAVVPDKPALEEIQQDVYDCFMGSFDLLGRVFDLNRKADNRLAGRIFKKQAISGKKKSSSFLHLSAWGALITTRKTALYAIALPSVRTPNLQNAIIWRMCFP